MSVVKARSRKERAEATRLRIVEAAHSAFLEQGYASTTMVDIASAAEVAVQTVYFVFRTKGDLLQAVYEHVVLGPDRVPPHLSPWWRAAVDEPNIDRAVRIFVAGTLDLLERAAPLVWAVLGDDTAREGYEFNESLRRNGYERIVGAFGAKHPYQPPITPDRARDILLLLTGPQVYSQLSKDMKWNRDEIEDWIVSSILQQLFGITTPSIPVSRRRARRR